MELTKSPLWEPKENIPGKSWACELTCGCSSRGRGIGPGIVVRRAQESSTPTLPEHLIRLEEEGWRNRQAQGLGGFEVDHQLKLHRLFHGEVGRVRAF
jgi:hypothetical protein